MLEQASEGASVSVVEDWQASPTATLHVQEPAADELEDVFRVSNDEQVMAMPSLEGHDDGHDLHYVIRGYNIISDPGVFRGAVLRIPCGPCNALVRAIEKGGPISPHSNQARCRVPGRLKGGRG